MSKVKQHFNVNLETSFTCQKFETSKNHAVYERLNDVNIFMSIMRHYLYVKIGLFIFKRHQIQEANESLN